MLVYQQGKVGDFQSIIHSIYTLNMLSSLTISVYLRPSLNTDVSVSPVHKTFS